MMGEQRRDRHRSVPIDTPKTTQAEMEAEDGFGLATEQSTTPTRGLAEELPQRAESALDTLRETIKEQTARSAAESDRGQTWLKSEQANELVKQAPKLKEVLSGAASAAKTVPKERSAAIAAEGKAVDRVQVQLANFRNARSG